MSQPWSVCSQLKQSSLEVCILQKAAWLSALSHLLISWLLSYYWEIAVEMYNTQKSLIINHETSWSASYFIMWCYFLGLHLEVPEAHCLTLHSVSAFILIHCTDSFTRSHIFSIPMHLLFNVSNICFCNAKSVIIHLPFIATPLIYVRLCLFVHWRTLNMCPSWLHSWPYHIDPDTHHFLTIFYGCQLP